MSSKKLQSSKIKAYLVLFALIVWNLIFLPLYAIGSIIPFVNHKRLVTIYHSGLCWLMGVEVKQVGEPSKHPSTLFVSNHVSYLDIPVLSSVINGFFVAKSEIASWPVIKHLAKAQNSIFIERRPSKAKSQIQVLRHNLESGNQLILFPEGTSTNGAEVLPLKSSLFSAAETDKADILIQPVSVVYGQFLGEGMDQDVRDNFAWYADFPFGPHILKVLGLGNITATVSFSEPVRLSDFENRKACALACETMMRESFDKAFIESGSTR